jgi:hypothetical protein
MTLKFLSNVVLYIAKFFEILGIDGQSKTDVETSIDT